MIPGAVALTIAGFGIRHWIAYSRLLHSGVGITVAVDNKLITSGKTNNYFVVFHIPTDPTPEEFSDETDQLTYESLSPQSKVFVTYDPQNYSNHLIGKPRPSNLESSTAWFVVGVAVFTLVGAGIRFAIISTAQKEWKAMSDWSYSEPPLVSVRISGGRSSNVTVVVDIEGAAPNRRSLSIESNSEEFHLGDTISVFYNPKPGELGAMRIASIKYVGLDDGHG